MTEINPIHTEALKRAEAKIRASNHLSIIGFALFAGAVALVAVNPVVGYNYEEDYAIHRHPELVLPTILTGLVSFVALCTAVQYTDTGHKEKE